MAFPASQQTLAAGLAEASQIASGLKSGVQRLRDQSAVGATSRAAYLGLLAQLGNAVNRWVVIAAIPGMGAYAQSQYGNAALNIGAEFTAMRNAAVALQNWIFTNFPKDAGGAVLLTTVDVNGVQTSLEFTSQQVSGFRTQADAFVATIS